MVIKHIGKIIKLSILGLIVISFLSICASSNIYSTSKQLINETEDYSLYEDSKGKTTLVIDCNQEKFVSENGSLVAINKNIDIIDDGDKIIYKVDEGKYKSYFSSDLEEEYLLNFYYEGKILNMTKPFIQFYDGSKTKEIYSVEYKQKQNIEKNDLSYSQIYDGVNIIYTYETNELKESIEINSSSIFDSYSKSKEKNKTDGSYLSLKWYYQSNFDISEYLVDPYIEDSKGNKNNFKYTLSEDKNGTYLQLNIEYSNFEKGNYPYIIDPTLNINDATICGLYNADNIVINGTLTVCDYNGTSNESYGWLWLNASDTISCGTNSICNITANSVGWLGGTGDPDGTGGAGINGTGYNGSTWYSRNYRDYSYGIGGPGTGIAQDRGGGGGASVISNASANLGKGGYTGFGNATNSTLYFGAGGGQGIEIGTTHTGDGGDGGGSIKLTAVNMINLTGAGIDVSGENGALARIGCGSGYLGQGGGGGAGKLFVNTTDLILAESYLLAIGGFGHLNYDDSSQCATNSDAGAGGSIVFYYKNINNNSLFTNVSGGGMLNTGISGSAGSLGVIGRDFYFNWAGNVKSYPVSPTNATLGPQTQNLTCNATTDANSLSNITIDIYFTNGSLSHNLTNNVQGSSNQTSFYPEFYESGYYTWECNGINNYYNINKSMRRTIEVDAFEPSVTINSPSNNTWYTTNDSVVMKCQVVGTNLNTLAFFHNISTTWSQNKSYSSLFSGNIYSNTITNLAEGKYIWNCAANKSINSSLVFASQTYNYTFGIDTILPQFSGNLTINTTADSQTFTFNYTSSDTNLGSCKYSIYNINNTIDGSSSNVSVSCNIENSATTSSFGNYTLRVYALDEAGNYNSSTLNFTTSQTASVIYTTTLGGGPSIIVSPIVIEGISVNKTFDLKTTSGSDDYSIIGNRGEIEQRYFYIYNTGNRESDISLTCTDSTICDWVTFQENPVHTYPSKDVPREIYFNVSIPDNVNTGDRYVFTIEGRDIENKVDLMQVSIIILPSGLNWFKVLFAPIIGYDQLSFQFIKADSRLLPFFDVIFTIGLLALFYGIIFIRKIDKSNAQALRNRTTLLIAGTVIIYILVAIISIAKCITPMFVCG